MNFETIREACCWANQQLPKLGIVDLTFGNVSVCDREQGVFAIKPSGVPYADLQPRDIVIISIDGKSDIKPVDGSLRPSSDTPTHRRLYQAFGSAGAVVHTHSRYATSFAQAGRPIPCLGTTHADYFGDEVPITRAMKRSEVENDYEWETGNVIVDRFQKLDPATVTAVLVRSHAPFVWGATAEKAVETAFALEIIAEMAYRSILLNREIPAIPPHLHEKHFSRKHGTNAYYGQV